MLNLRKTARRRASNASKPLTSLLRRAFVETIDGIEIRGGVDFQRRTREALERLRPLAAFPLVRSHLAVIRQGERSGVEAWLRNPVFTVGAPTWSHSALWYAGAIAHDAFHAKLYRDAALRDPATRPRLEVWSGSTAEKACLAFQRDVLAALDADGATIAYIDAHAANPIYQGRGSWLDYRRRWW